MSATKKQLGRYETACKILAADDLSRDYATYLHEQVNITSTAPEYSYVMVRKYVYIVNSNAEREEDRLGLLLAIGHEPVFFAE